MAGPCPNLTPENWMAAYLVLIGEVGFKATKREAAAAAGITTSELHAWVDRSRERRADDEPWVWEIAEQFDKLHESRAEFLRGVAWERAVHGVDTPVIFRGEVMNETVKKVDNAVLLRLLEVYDPEFRAAKQTAAKGGKEDPASDEEPEDLFRRLLASIRMKQIHEEATQQTLPTPPVLISPPATPAPSEAVPASLPPRRNLEVPDAL